MAVSVETRRTEISIPSCCACCLSDRAAFGLPAVATHRTLVARVYSSWQFNYCAGCWEHVQAHKRAWMTAALIGLPISVAAGAKMFSELNYVNFMLTVFGAGVIVAGLHTILFRISRKPGPSCSGEAPIVSVQASAMQGPPYTFTFANHAFGEAFRQANPYSEK